MKKFLKVALVACACALIAVPFAGCDLGGKNEFKVTEAKWTAALSADKYAFSSASSNPSSSSLTIYVDGSLAKQIATSQSGTTTTYFQKNGDSSHFYNLNTNTDKWERNTAPMPFESLTFKNMSNLDYSEFTYDSDDKAYEAEDYLLAGAVPQLFEEIKVEFKSNVLKKITLSTGNTTSVISFLSNDFTISLPQNILYNEVTEAEWEAALPTSKFQHEITTSTSAQLTQVDGDIAYIYGSSTESGPFEYYLEIDGAWTREYSYNSATRSWEKYNASRHFIYLTWQEFLYNLDYSQFTFDNDSKCYKAENYEYNGSFNYSCTLLEVYFEDGILKKIVKDNATTITMIYDNFTISLPSVS